MSTYAKISGLKREGAKLRSILLNSLKKEYKSKRPQEVPKPSSQGAHTTSPR